MFKKSKEDETSYTNPSNVDVLREDFTVIGTFPSSLSVKDESEAAIASLSDSASKIDLSGGVPELDLWSFNFYLKKVFSQVSSLPWFNMLKTSPLSYVPLSHIPKSVNETAVDWINKIKSDSHWKFVIWALDRLLIDWAAHAKGEEQPFILYQVATLVELAMVLRAKPDSLTGLLPMLRWRPMYHGEDKLPLIVWMMSHAYQEDLPAALYSWAANLLPLVVSNKCCYSSQSIHLILQFVEMILSSNPEEVRAVLLNEPVRHGARLIPPRSFEMLVRLTFPPRGVEEATTERFQAIYPLLKEVALAPDSTSADALKQIFTFSLKLAGEEEEGNNPALASEATSIAFSVLTQNVDCFKQWDVLYKENLEASVTLLKKLVVDEWEYHAPKLLSSLRSDTLTFQHAMNSFRMKNEKAIIEGVANLSLYREADKSCKLILTPGSGGRNIMDLNKSNPEKGETAKIDPSDLKLSEIEEALLSLSEAAKKMDPSPLAAYLDQVLDDDWFIPRKQMLRVIRYYGDELSQVSFQWVKLFQDYPLSKLIHVPLSLIPKPVYEKTVDFINVLPCQTMLTVVLWASDFILTEWPGVVVKVVQDKSKVAAFVVLAMVLRTRPDALTLLLSELRESPTYQGQDKLPVIIWMMAQASQGDLCAGLYSWVRNLLPLVANNKDYSSSQSTHLILQFVEMILSSNPEARAVLLNGAVRHGEWLIPPCSFEMLVRLTFPARVVEATTERFQAIYPLLKEVALAPDTSADALEQIFTFSLELAGGQGNNPALANEATEIAISVLTQNVDCFKQWDVLYKENLEASVALLKKIVDEGKDHSLKLSSSSSDTLTVKNAVNSFRMKNEKAITEGVANLSLYKEADQSCKLISRRLSRGPGIAPLTAMD